MNSILNNNNFFVKEHVGMFKAANNYDIYDPNDQNLMMTCREDNLGLFTKFLRFTDQKIMSPFEIEIKTTTGEKVLTVKRGFAFFLSTVQVFDENDKLVGTFKQKLLSLSGKFDLLDPEGRLLCVLQGKWTSWDFKFLKEEREIAAVSKEWAGFKKEFFTTADNYMLTIEDSVPANKPIRLLILAAVMCIDMVLKE